MGNKESSRIISRQHFSSIYSKRKLLSKVTLNIHGHFIFGYHLRHSLFWSRTLLPWIFSFIFEDNVSDIVLPLKLCQIL